MQVKTSALDRHLKGTLAPIYLISGDETLLVEEACTSLLAAAEKAGYSERSVIFVDPNFSWNDVLQDAASMSLFAEKRLLDLRNPAAKFDREASEVLREYCARPAQDTLLLIRCGRLDRRQKTSAWFKAIDKVGAVVLVWPVSAAELPGWLRQRLKLANVALDAAALEYFAERVEGNLLAAVQEIEKIKLLELTPGQPITVEALADALEDASHYDTFELLDAVYAGDKARVARMVEGLRQEGVAIFAILGALTSQLRAISGDGFMPPQKRRAAERLVTRLGSTAAIDRVLAQCSLVDQQGKGQLLGDAWLSLANLLLRLAGGRLPSLETQLEYMRRP